MQLAVRPYATAGAALLAAGILVAPAATPPPQVETVHAQVQLDQIVAGPGALLGQVLVNQIQNVQFLTIGVLTATSDILNGLVASPAAFIAQLAMGTGLLDAIGVGIAPVAVGFLNAAGAVFRPVFFGTIRALENAVFTAQQTFVLVTEVLGGVPLATAFADFQSAVLAQLQIPLPPSVTGTATTMSISALNTVSAPATATVATSSANAVASVQSTTKQVVTTLIPRTQPHVAATITTGSSLSNAGSSSVSKVASSNSGTANKLAAVGVGRHRR